MATTSARFLNWQIALFSRFHIKNLDSIENPLTRNAFILAPLAIITFQVRKPPILILIVAEKSYEKIPSQYERHERQHKQRPITIAVYFWRGFATHEGKAKDTIAPRVHGSSIGRGPLMVLNTPSDIKEAELRVLCCMMEEWRKCPNNRIADLSAELSTHAFRMAGISGN